VTLVERERAMQRVCFAPDAPEADLERLGTPDRWLIYRSMVRGRLRKVVVAALKKTSERLGDRLDDDLAAWLDQRPPSTRYFREIPEEFTTFCLPRWRGDHQLSAWLPDLATLEITTWRVKHISTLALEVVPIAFDRVLALDPTVQLLRLDYPVHERHEGDVPKDATFLCVHRRASDHEAVTTKLNAIAADLVECWLRRDRSLTESVQHVAAKRHVPVDAKLVEGLSTMLADFLERGIVLGSVA
jgi:hypothetical protein